MAVNAYINFPGNCREAIEFYAKVFGTQPKGTMTFGQGPNDPAHPLPPAAKDLIMHSELEVGGATLMFSDTYPGMQLTVGNNISLTLVSQNREEIVRVFNGLKEGGRVNMDLQQTFWTPLYGMLTDKFGIPWQVSLDSGEVRQ